MWNKDLPNGELSRTTPQQWPDRISQQKILAEQSLGFALQKGLNILNGLTIK